MAEREVANVKVQLQRFKETASEAGARMTKEEFAGVIGGLVKPQEPAKDADEDGTGDG